MPAREPPLLRRLLVDVGLTVAAFGLAPLFKKVAIEGGATPGTVAVVTLAVAAVTGILLLAGSAAHPLDALFGRRQLLPLATVGILAGGLVTVLVAHALTVTTATNRSLFQAAYPAATLVFAHVMLGERLRAGQYAGIGAIMLGLVLANGSDGGVRVGIGFWLLALTMPLIGFSDVYGKRLTERLPPRLLGAGRSLYGALFVAAVAPWTMPLALPSAAAGVALVAAGVTQALGVWTLYRALEAGQASLVAGLLAAAPLVTLLAEAGLLGLALAPGQWLGVVIVVLAAYLLGRRR